MSNDDRREKVLSNLSWRFAERIFAQGVKFIVELLLARLLLPEDYGIIAIVAVFITILNVFIDSGLGNALIQKKNADDLDFSSVFYFNISICLFLYLLMFILAPFIAKFYNNEILTPVIRVLCISLLISGVKNIQQAYVSKHFLFKRFFFATLGGTIGAAVIGIFMAYHGFGVWALVAQQLFNAAIDTLILWCTVKWRPKACFSLTRLKQLLSFGWKLLVSALIDTVYNDLRSLVIGKVYTSSDLAFYNRGQQLPMFCVSNINTSIDSVLLPAMSAEQDDNSRLKAMTRRAIKTSTYVIMPIMIGLAICADSIVSLILTDKWLPCVFFFRIFCFSYAFYPIHTANLNAIKALGRSDIFLKLEIIKKSLGIFALAFSVFISVKAMAVSALIVSIISQVINSWPNKKLLNYSYLEQIKDIVSHIGLSCMMGIIVFCVSLLNLNIRITLTIQVFVGVLVYIVLSKVFHVESLEYLYSALKAVFIRKKR